MNEPDEWVELDDGEIIITEDAPNRVWQLIENEPEYTGAMLNFHIACEAIGYDTLERVPEPHEWRELRNKHIGEMKDAVRDGDLETAQEELKHAELIANAGRRVTKSLIGSEND